MMNATITKLAETATSNQILQKILDTTRECVLVVDRDMRIANCNVPAAVAFGRDGLDIENKRLSEVLRDLDLHEAFRIATADHISSDVLRQAHPGSYLRIK